MNILFYQHQYPAFGGIEMVTTLLAGQFSALGHKVGIVSFVSKPGTQLLSMLPIDVVVHKLADACTTSEGNIHELTELLDNFVPDVVLFQDSYAPIHRILFKAMEEYKERHGLQKTLPSHRATFTVIPNPVSVADLGDIGVEKKNRILFVGSLLKIKGVDRIVRIWNRIARKYPDWELQIVGDGPERGVLTGLVDGLSCPRVDFVGFRTDPGLFFGEAKLFVMASDFEGWPMVMGEAMRCGCVPVSFDSFGAIYEMVVDGLDGVIVKKFDEEAFARKLEELICDQNLLARMSQCARCKAGQFSTAHIAAKWNDLFRRFDHKNPGLITVEHSSPFLHKNRCSWPWWRRWVLVVLYLYFKWRRQRAECMRRCELVRASDVYVSLADCYNKEVMRMVGMV